MIEIKNLSKTYPGGKKAVDNLNITINAGDLFAFIGHNGAGKTTTIKTIVGILEFEEGEVFIDGLSIKENLLACKQKIAYLPDNPDLYDALTGIAYLNFIADVYKVPAEKRKYLIETLAKDFSIYNDLNKFIATYSHGMKQKLALISAFIHEPKVLILDEPFVGLDPKAAFTVKQRMIQMCENGGAIFFSTHVLEVAQKLCNKIAIIKDGRLIKTGLMEDVIGDKNLEAIFMELTDYA